MRAVTIAVAMLLAGCTTTRYVTPWLRTTVTAHPTFMAESGSGSGNELVVQRRVDGKWIEMPGASELAFAFAHGTRVLLKDTVVREDGSSVKLDCPGDIRGTRGPVERGRGNDGARLEFGHQYADRQYDHRAGRRGF